MGHGHNTWVGAQHGGWVTWNPDVSCPLAKRQRILFLVVISQVLSIYQALCRTSFIHHCCSPVKKSQGRCCHEPILQMKKLRHRELSYSPRAGCFGQRARHTFSTPSLKKRPGAGNCWGKVRPSALYLNFTTWWLFLPESQCSWNKNIGLGRQKQCFSKIFQL